MGKIYNSGSFSRGKWVRLFKNDVSYAQLRDLPISETLRSLFHAHVVLLQNCGQCPVNPSVYDPNLLSKSVSKAQQGLRRADPPSAHPAGPGT